MILKNWGFPNKRIDYSSFYDRYIFMKFFTHLFIHLILIFSCHFVLSQKCLKVFDGPTNYSSQKAFGIKELNDFGFIPKTEEKIIKRVLAGEDIRLIDLNQVRKNYKNLQSVFSGFDIHVAYKAFSTTRALGVLNEEFNSKFEIATLEEFKDLKRNGVSPKNIIFTHPDKDALEISKSFKGGIRTYISDSKEDLKLLSKYAPKSKILIRVSTDFGIPKKATINSEDIDNFDERFGVSFETAKELIFLAGDLNLQPVGVSFHVGTQTEDAREWIEPIKRAAKLYMEMKEVGVDLKVLDVGGGLPMRYREDIPKLKEFGKVIKKTLSTYFIEGIYPETLIIEPGRFVTASAGITIGRVINVKPSQKNPDEIIVTVSTGQYSAGITLISYGHGVSFYTLKNKNKCSVLKGHSVLGDIYGKACASIDKINSVKEPIPSDLKSGDLIVVTGTGAYSGELATSNWCGKKAPTDIIFDGKRGNLVYEGQVGC